MPLNLDEILAPRPRVAGPYGIGWMVIFRFADRGWVDRAFLTDLFDAATRMSFWTELDRSGVGYRVDGPIGDVGRFVETLIARDRRAVTLDRSDGDASLELEALDATLELRLRLDGDVLARRRSAVLDDPIELVTRLRGTHARCRVPLANAYPYPDGRIEFARLRPSPAAIWRAEAAVDVFDPELSLETDVGPRVASARNLAATPVPACAKREERAGVVVVRWVDDPTDRARMSEGLAARDAWLFEHVQVEHA